MTLQMFVVGLENGEIMSRISHVGLKDNKTNDILYVGNVTF